MGIHLADNDERLLSVVSGLRDSDWAHPSLCGDWTNHEVLAHLVHGCSASPARVVARMAAFRGSFDAANVELARELAGRRSPTELIGDLRAVRGGPRGLGRLLPKRLLLGDHVLHELDIVFALGRPSSVPGHVLAEVLDTQVSVPNPFVPARRRARELSLRATDIAWSRPGHPELGVAGAATDLASVLAGRRHALSRLHGPGVDLLRRRVG